MFYLGGGGRIWPKLIPEPLGRASGGSDEVCGFKLASMTLLSPLLAASVHCGPMLGRYWHGKMVSCRVLRVV